MLTQNRTTMTPPIATLMGIFSGVLSRCTAGDRGTGLRARRGRSWREALAFRDSEDASGDRRICAHLQRSVFGRNEKCGPCAPTTAEIRLNASGVDLPSSRGIAPSARYQAESYPAIERGDVVWIYMPLLD